MKPTFDGRRPELSYPCAWTYTVFGRSEEDLREAVEDLIGHLKYKIELSNKSPGGKYVSLSVDLIVQSEDQRNRIFRKLSGHDEVRFVL